MKSSCFFADRYYNKNTIMQLAHTAGKGEDTDTNLHLDKDAFRVLIESIHEQTGYSSDVLEKDYYVVPC